MSKGVCSAWMAGLLLLLLGPGSAQAGPVLHGDLDLVYEQTTTNFPSPPERIQQSSYDPCDEGDLAGSPLLAGGGWIYDSTPMATPFETGQAYFSGFKFRSQYPPKTPESWHEIADNVSANNSLGIGELTVCGNVPGVSYERAKTRIGKKTTGSAKVACPSGAKVLGGGGVVKGPLGKPRLIGSFPYDDSDGNATPDDGWKATGYNGSKKKRKLTVFGICAPLGGLDYRDGSVGGVLPRVQGSINCAPGTHAVGGGFRVESNPKAARVIESRTVPPGSAWSVTTDTMESGGFVDLDVHVICHS